MTEDGEEKFRGLIVLLALVTSVWVIYWIIIPLVFSGWQTRGTFGDMFGAINALFSGLAFVGIIYAIILQKRELMLQRLELESTRVELKRSAEAQEKTIIYQTITSLFQEYGSTQMLYAVRTLWDFYRKEGKKNFAKKYKEIRSIEIQEISSLDKEKRIEAEQGTLDNQRRLVKNFYDRLAGLYTEGILPKRLLYLYWGESDLQIIPKILIPMENILRKALDLEPLHEYPNSMKLYQDLKDFAPAKQ